MLFVPSRYVKRQGLQPGEYAQDMTIDQASEKLITPGHTYHECITGVCKIYLDREEYLDAQPNNDVVVSATELLHSNVKHIINQIKISLKQEYNTDEHNLSYVVATRHGFCSNKQKYKLSFRPYILGIRIHHSDIPFLIEGCGLSDYFDTVPYGKNQLLACINGRKDTNDNRILRADRENEHIGDYLAQHISDKWALMEFHKQEAGVITPERKYPPPDPDFVSGLVDCLDMDRVSDYKWWITVGIILRNVSETLGDYNRFFDLFCDWSALSAKFPGVTKCRDKWDSFDRRDGLTIGTLIRIAKIDNPAKFNRIKGQTKEVRDNTSDTTETSLDIVNLLRDKVSALAALKDDTTFTVQGNDVKFDDGSLSGWIRRPSYIVEMVDGEWIGPIHGKEVTLNASFHRVSPDRIPSTISNYICKMEKGCTTLTPNGKDAATKDLEILCDQPGKDGHVTRVRRKGMKDQIIQSQIGARRFNDVWNPAWQQSVEDALGVSSVTQIANFGCNILVNNNYGESDADFMICRDQLLNYSVSGGFRKSDGIMYQAVEGCPLAFVPVKHWANNQDMKYADFINKALKDCPEFIANPRRLSDLTTFMSGYTLLDKLPEYEPSRDLLSFSNGVLELTSNVFYPYSEYDGCFGNKVARHHIPYEYTGNTATPSLDKVLNAQFDEDTSELLCALLGRAFFKVGQLDDFQVAPYLVGQGGTGKSLITLVIEATMRPGTVGNLAPKREEIFGMANIASKELVIGRDMPAKLSGSLSQELMQTMVSGEQMEIARKNGIATNETWTSPLIVTSNHMPDYITTGSNVSRRFVVFLFNNVIKNPDYTLKHKLKGQELPNIVARCLAAYFNLLRKVETQQTSFWNLAPKKVTEWQAGLTAATNKLYEFLAMDEDERGVSIQSEEGKATWLLDFKAAMEEKMGSKTFNKDIAVFNKFGFEVSNGYENVCKSCKQPGGHCCDAYNRNNRTKKEVIYGMIMRYK